MKTILTLVLSLLMISSYSQYSAYYNVYKSVDVNQKINISGNINTIDFGALSLANAQREKNRLESQKYVDERTKEIANGKAKKLAEANFGTQIDLVGKNDETNNFKKYTYHLRVPHPSIFSHLKGGNFENVSDDGVKTELLIFLPMYNKDKIEVNVEENQKFSEDTIGQIIKDGNDKIFLHKKDIGRATVFGISGFRGTLIFEDNYEYRITENYQSYSDDGILYNVKVRYSGSKKEINFEKLEGRRYYLRRLIEKIISTASITDYKFINK